MSEPLIQLPTGDWVLPSEVKSIHLDCPADAAKIHLIVSLSGGPLPLHAVFDDADKAAEARDQLATLVNAAKAQAAPVDMACARDVARIKAALAATGHLLTDDATANDRRANLYAIGGLLKAFTDDALDPERTDR